MSTENDVIALLRHLLPESKEQAKDVIEEISIRQNQDDPTDSVSAQRWSSRKAYEDYLNWRTDSEVRANCSISARAAVSPLPIDRYSSASWPRIRH
jgi:hypothetical protein